jgi:hypothetical protein
MYARNLEVFIMKTLGEENIQTTQSYMEHTHSLISDSQLVNPKHH